MLNCTIVKQSVQSQLWITRINDLASSTSKSQGVKKKKRDDIEGEFID